MRPNGEADQIFVAYIYALAGAYSMAKQTEANQYVVKRYEPYASFVRYDGKEFQEMENKPDCTEDLFAAFYPDGSADIACLTLPATLEEFQTNRGCRVHCDGNNSPNCLPSSDAPAEPQNNPDCKCKCEDCKRESAGPPDYMEVNVKALVDAIFG